MDGADLVHGFGVLFHDDGCMYEREGRRGVEKEKGRGNRKRSAIKGGGKLKDGIRADRDLEEEEEKAEDEDEEKKGIGRETVPSYSCEAK